MSRVSGVILTVIFLVAPCIYKYMYICSVSNTVIFFSFRRDTNCDIPERPISYVYSHSVFNIQLYPLFSGDTNCDTPECPINIPVCPLFSGVILTVISLNAQYYTGISSVFRCDSNCDIPECQMLYLYLPE